MELINGGAKEQPPNKKAPAGTERLNDATSKSVEDEIHGVNFERAQIRRFKDHSPEEQLAIFKHSPRFFENRAACALAELSSGEREQYADFFDCDESLDREWVAREVLAALPQSKFYFPFVEPDESVVSVGSKLRKRKAG